MAKRSTKWEIFKPWADGLTGGRTSAAAAARELNKGAKYSATPGRRYKASGGKIYVSKSNPAIKRAKPSGWINAKRIKFVKRGGRLTLLVQKAKPKARKRRARR